MKTFSIQSIVIAVFLLIGTLAAQAQIMKAEIVATGLTCSMCSNAINKQLEALANVAQVDTDLNTNTFIITFKSQTAVQPDDLKNAVEKAGFFVGSMILTAQLKPHDISENSFQLHNNSFYITNDHKIQAGETKYRLLDKGFITQRELKKLEKENAKATSLQVKGKHQYHVQII